jgi:hypothetical protein
MTYTIINNNNGQEDGPFDLIMLIKKARSGRLHPDDLVWEEGFARGEAVPAIMHPELLDVFRELENQPHHEPLQTNEQIDFKRLWRIGVMFLQENHGVTVFSGLYAAIAIFPILAVYMALPLLLAIPLGWAITVAGMYPLFGLMWMILRLHRGQPAGLETVSYMLQQRQKDVIKLCMILGSAVYVGMPFFGIPSVLVLVFTLPAFFYVMEFDMEPWEAIALSRRRIGELGFDAFVVMFALTMIGFMGWPLILPLVVLLPIVLYAFAKLYDDVLASVN